LLIIPATVAFSGGAGKEDGAMKVLMLLAAAAFAVAMVGPVMASIDDYPQLQGIAVATAPHATTTTQMAAAPGPVCPPGCGCPHAQAASTKTAARPARAAARETTQVAKAKPASWLAAVPYNY
jgi:hypothetical protein